MVARRILSLLVAVGVLAPSLARADALRLEDALKMALGTNERALKAPLRIQAAEGQLARARAGFLPTLVANATAGISTAETQNRNWNGVGTLTLSQPIVNPSAYPLYAAARHGLESERWGATDDKRQLSFDTARGFLVVLATEQLVGAAERRLELAKANQQAAEARAKAGLASSNDVTLATVDTASAGRDLVQAKLQVSTSYIALSYLVGRAVAPPLAAPEKTIRAAKVGTFKMDELVKIAQTRRPDLRSAQEKTLSAEDSAREPLYRLAPTLAAQGQIKVVPDPLPMTNAHDESAQLTLTWTLFDAGVRYADRKSLTAQAQSSALDERALRRSIATDVASALATLRAGRDTLKLADEGVAAATQNIKEIEILYGQGLARAIEVVDANARRYDAEVTRATAEFAVEQGYLGLRLAIGLDPLDPEVPTQAAGRTP